MRVSRFVTAPVSAIVLSIVVAGAVAADGTTGQVGHYVFTDSASKPGATCVYNTTGGSEAFLNSVVVRAPSVWWPDTSSSSNTQHGQVGWKAIVKEGSPGSWSTIASSSVQKKTAYEDHPFHDPADKAPFTNLTVSFTSNKFMNYLVTVKVFWYRADGSVKGTATHDVVHYRDRIDGTSIGASPAAYCYPVLGIN